MNHTFWTFGNNAAANWDHFVSAITRVFNIPMTTETDMMVFLLLVLVVALSIAYGIATVRQAETGMRALEATTLAMRARQDEMRARRERGE
jgi:uncharacterized membrane protein YczE